MPAAIDEPGPFSSLAIALGLGLLVGLQREWARAGVAGIRTFPLITVLGVLCAFLAPESRGLLVATGLLAVAGMLAVGNWLQARRDDAGPPDPGLTTEIAALVMFLVGAALGSGHPTPAVVVGGGVAVLLQYKGPLHRLASAIGEEDLRAILRLVLVGLVILPVLPDRSYGPYGVLNPFEIWLMVVLIVGISLGAYVGHRLLGPRGGMLAAGILGGLISSTATTVSCARRARRLGRSAAEAVVIVLASTVVFGRVLVEVAVAAPDALGTLAPPLLAMTGFMAALSVLMITAQRIPDEEGAAARAPSEWKSAIFFGFLYALVLLAVAATRQRLGAQGLYAVAALSGLTDVDAITLSTSQLIERGGLAPSTGWRVILVGVMSNLVFKGLLAGLLGSPRLAIRLVPPFLAALAAGAAMLLVWPD